MALMKGRDEARKFVVYAVCPEFHGIGKIESQSDYFPLTDTALRYKGVAV